MYCLLIHLLILCSLNHGKLIIIGSGLAGHSAAAQANYNDPHLEIIVYEKETRYGGNSFKATSGIKWVFYKICCLFKQLNYPSEH